MNINLKSVLNLITGTFVFLALTPRVFSQKNSASAIEGKSFICNNGKLSSKFDSCNGKGNEDFFAFKGFKISSDYLIIDSLSVDLNKDHVSDYIIVLSPQIQEKDNYRLPCYKTQFNKRLLLIMLSNKSKYYIQTISEEVILNRAEYQSEPFRKIAKESEGFSLEFFIGTSVRCYYNFYFKYSKGYTYMYKSNSECYLIDLSKNKKSEKQYKCSKATSLPQIDIRNFLSIPDLR